MPNEPSSDQNQQRSCFTDNIQKGAAEKEISRTVREQLVMTRG
jgi:hypothetical protein